MATNGEPQLVPRRHDDKAKALIMRQTGESIALRCKAQNEQVDAGMLPPEERITDAQIALNVKHAQERAALEIDRNNDRYDAGKKFQQLFAEMDARHLSERSQLKGG